MSGALVAVMAAVASSLHRRCRHETIPSSGRRRWLWSFGRCRDDRQGLGGLIRRRMPGSLAAFGVLVLTLRRRWLLKTPAGDSRDRTLSATGLFFTSLRETPKRPSTGKQVPYMQVLLSCLCVPRETALRAVPNDKSGVGHALLSLGTARSAVSVDLTRSPQSKHLHTP